MATAKERNLKIFFNVQKFEKFELHPGNSSSSEIILYRDLSTSRFMWKYTSEIIVQFLLIVNSRINDCAHRGFYPIKSDTLLSFVHDTECPETLIDPLSRDFMPKRHCYSVTFTTSIACTNKWFNLTYFNTHLKRFETACLDCIFLLLMVKLKNHFFFFFKHFKL